MTGRAGGDTRLVVELAGGATVADAATAAGMSESTAYRRLRDAEFRQLVDEARSEMLSRSVSRLTAASVDAVDTLRALLGSEMDFARLGAARAILEVGLKYREQHDLSERVSALEDQLTTKEKTGWRPKTA